MNDETQNQIIKSKKGEGYINTAVKLLISIVCGSLILGSVFFIQKDTVLTTTNGRISSLFGLPLVNPLDGDSGTTPGSGDTGGGNNPGTPGSQSEWEVEGNTLVGYNGEITDGMTLIIPAEVNGTPIEKIQHQDADASAPDKTINILGTTKDTSVAAVVIEDGIKEIGDCAFAGMENLSGTVQLPDSVTKIGEKAFIGTKIQYVFSNSSQIEASPNAFNENTILNYPINDTSGKWIVTNGVITKYTGTIEENSTVIIPAYVNGEPVTKIEANWYTSRPACTIIVSNGIKTIGENAFQSIKFNDIILPPSLETIEQNAFKSATFKKDLILPEGLKEIGYGAFNSAKGGVKVSWPSTLETIDATAFKEAEFTGDVILPDSLKNLGVSAFYEARFNGNLKLSKSLTAIQQYCFYNSLLRGHLEIPEGVTSISQYAFYGTYFSSVTFPNTLKTIAYRAFYGTKLEGEIYIPDSVTSIANEAFAYTWMTTTYGKITSVSYKKGTSIGRDAFAQHHCKMIERN